MTPARTRTRGRSRSTSSSRSLTARRSSRCPRPRSPAPLDPPIAPITGDTLAWTLPRLEQLAADLGVRVTYEPLVARPRRLLPPARAADRDQQRVSRSTSRPRRSVTSSRTRSSASTTSRRIPQLDYATGGTGRRIGRPHRLRLPRPRHRRQLDPVSRRLERHVPEDAFEQIAALVDRLAPRLEDALEPRASDEHQRRTAAAA